MKLVSAGRVLADGEVAWRKGLFDSGLLIPTFPPRRVVAWGDKMVRPSGAANGVAIHLKMSHVPKRNHYVSAVAFEPAVVEYLNDLAQRMGMSRSWVINTIVQEYAMFIEQKNITPLKSRTTILR